MADRYFVESPIDRDRATLVAAEAHHLAHVMRAKPGDQVLLFDGSGAEFAASVETVGRAQVELVILERRPIDRELSLSITLGVALPKGDRQRWLVEKAVELGTARLVPLVAERSNDRESPASLKRLARAVIEAAKQCGRNRLMPIESPLEVAGFLAARSPQALGLFAEPGARPLAQALDSAPGSREIFLAVGPEGGFTTSEIAQATAAGWQTVGLGQRILRVETAAIALVASLAMRATE